MKVKKARNSVSFVESLWSDGGSAWKKPACPDNCASLCPGGRFFPYLLEIQFLCHKIICQQIADDACGQREQHAENPAHPEVGRTVYRAVRATARDMLV